MKTYRAALKDDTLQADTPWMYHKYGIISRTVEKTFESPPSQVTYPDESSTIAFPADPFSVNISSEAPPAGAAGEDVRTLSNSSIIALVPPHFDSEVKAEIIRASELVGLCAFVQLVLLIFAEFGSSSTLERLIFSSMIFVDLLYLLAILRKLPFFCYLEKVSLIFGTFLGFLICLRSIWNVLFLVVSIVKIYAISHAFYHMTHHIFINPPYNM